MANQLAEGRTEARSVRPAPRGLRVLVKDQEAWAQIIQSRRIRLKYADFINRIVDFDVTSEVNAALIRIGLKLGYFEVVKE